MSRTFVALGLCLVVVSIAVSQEQAEQKQSREVLTEPVYRVSKAKLEPAPATKAGIASLEPKPNGHPLDPAIQMARDGLKSIQANVQDYSCTIVKQERINGELLPQEYMYAEIRNRREQNGQIVTPFSVYMYFLKPASMKGREVIYVENENDGNLVAHEGSGLLRKVGAVKLKPDGAMAMRNNRYPITELGIEKLISELIKKGERDRQRDECAVEFKKGVKINGRACTLLEVTHPHSRPYFDFHIARIYIDDELNLPLRYEAYTWPTTPGGQPELQECYTYLNMKVNIGLKDDNFRQARFQL
jgi:hypothetical protein